MPFPLKVRKKMEKILGSRWVKDDPVTCFSYRCDGLTLHTSLPMGVVFPSTQKELVDVVKLLAASGISFLPRGAGTGLSGGAVPLEESVIIEMFRFRDIGEVDLTNRTITVGPGVVNLAISQAAAPLGLYFVPDPSSQKACSIGGNVAENAGGPHTLKYGVTVNHILGLEAVLPNGDVLKLGANHWGVPGPDLLGLFVGSEGTFGIVTQVVCRLTPLPEATKTLLAIFPTVHDASEAVSAIIATGIIPSALEMMDQMIIHAVEDAFQVGFPRDAGALLIIELEDLEDGLVEETEQLTKLIERYHVKELRVAKDATDRAAIWQARKEAFGALGRITPSCYTQDGVIPRSKLPIILSEILEIAGKLHLQIGNVFHAGDGNLHPIILYNPHDQNQVDRAIEAGDLILKACLKVGGTLSGEHGVGLEKSSMMAAVYQVDDLENMARIRDCFNPNRLLNPGKVLPTPGKCSDMKLLKMKSGIGV